VNKPTFGCIIATIAFFLVPNAHAVTTTITDRQLTPNETTNIFFDDDFQPHTPSNPTTSMLVVPVAVGRPSGADEVNEHVSNAHNNVPTDIPGGDVSQSVLTAVALGLIPQPSQSEPSVPSFSNPLPPAILLFGTALVGLLVAGRRRLKSPHLD